MGAPQFGAQSKEWLQIDERSLGRPLNFSFGIIGKRPFLAKSWQGAFWTPISAIWRPLGWLLKFSSGIIGKRPFLAKSWPGGAFWIQILARELG